MKSINKAIIFISISTIVFMMGCGKNKNSSLNPQQQLVPVLVEKVIQKDVPVDIENIGNVEAYSTVSVLSQVGGILTQVHFQEGQDVKRGDLLITIDPQPFQNAIQQAEASMARDMALLKHAKANLSKSEAELKNARTELKRLEELIKAGVVTQQEYDEKETEVETIQATIEANQASVNSAEESIRWDKTAIDNTKIQLSYCYIHSPMNGQTGSLLIDKGNVVKANDRPILIINQLDPINVTFSVPEQELSRIKKYSSAGKLKVEAIIPNELDHRVEGELVFVDNAVNSRTGTIQLKAKFQNKDHLLWPNQFVNIILTLTVETGSIVIPSEAVQTGQEGEYVFIVKPDNTVDLRPVKIKRVFEHETLVESGLQPGETVVTDGQLNLSPGSKIEIKTGLTPEVDKQS